jgi:hypothetical protein
MELALQVLQGLQIVVVDLIFEFYEVSVGLLRLCHLILQLLFQMIYLSCMLIHKTWVLDLVLDFQCVQFSTVILPRLHNSALILLFVNHLSINSQTIFFPSLYYLSEIPAPCHVIHQLVFICYVLCRNQVSFFLLFHFKVLLRQGSWLVIVFRLLLQHSRSVCTLQLAWCISLYRLPRLNTLKILWFSRPNFLGIVLLLVLT